MLLVCQHLMDSECCLLARTLEFACWSASYGFSSVACWSYLSLTVYCLLKQQKTCIQMALCLSQKLRLATQNCGCLHCKLTFIACSRLCSVFCKPCNRRPCHESCRAVHLIPLQHLCQVLRAIICDIIQQKSKTLLSLPVGCCSMRVKRRLRSARP